MRGIGTPAITGPESTLFKRPDWRELVGSAKWFLGKGSRPEAVIGSTGLLFWFPTVYTRFVPSWMLNVATTIHSDEALLAVGFLFTIHFFNTHFRPEKFPMDVVTFTEGVLIEEFKKDHSREDRQMARERRAGAEPDAAPGPASGGAQRRIGFSALTIDLLLMLLTIYAEVVAYRQLCSILAARWACRTRSLALATGAGTGSAALLRGVRQQRQRAVAVHG